MGWFLYDRDLRPTTLFKKGTMAYIFRCQFCKIFKNVFFKEHLRGTEDFC